MAFMSVLLERYSDAFVWFSLRPPVKEGKEKPFDIPYRFVRAPQQPARFPVVKQFLRLFPWAWIAGQQAAKFGRSEDVDVVLADLAFESVLAGRVASKALSIPLLVSIHDDPVNRIRIKNLPGWMVQLYKREFAKTLSASKRCGVISDYMGENYLERYGVQTTTLFIGVEQERCLPPKVLSSQREPIVIGSVGSVNSVENWETLLRAVELLNQRSGEGSYRVLHVGDLAPSMPVTDHLEVTGWVPEEMFVEQLRRIDIGFLNWSFAPEVAETARTSFPLKITSYIQAQTPMLALGPRDSTAVRFVQDYRCGVACIEPVAETLAACLKDFVGNPDDCAAAQANVKGLNRQFSRAAFFEQFEDFVT